jgi:calcineurin-like phosphoesterase family protein
MYKIIKHEWTERSKLFWSSDWHNFHNPSWPIPIWESRGHANHIEAAKFTRDKINERVGEDDTLYYLGDGFLNAEDTQVIEWLSSLNCQNIKYLFGNHESVMYRLYKKEVEKLYGTDKLDVFPIKMGNVEFLGNHQEILVGKQKIVMNHFPLRIWNNDARSAWMVSGHSHGQDAGRLPEAEYQKGLDCGWDIKKDVWSFDEIEDVMSTKTIKILDHNRVH